MPAHVSAWLSKRAGLVGGSPPGDIERLCSMATLPRHFRPAGMGPECLRWWRAIVTAEEQVRMQAALPGVVDNSLSKTVNFPRRGHS